MRCQIPGCKNKGIKKTTSGIFCGIHLDKVSICVCGNHSNEEVETQIAKIGEGLVNNLQEEQFNPFRMSAKIYKK